MSGKISVKWNLGHFHEVNLPDDLNTQAGAARLIGRQPTTISQHIAAGRILSYPITA